MRQHTPLGVCACGGVCMRFSVHIDLRMMTSKQTTKYAMLCMRQSNMFDACYQFSFVFISFHFTSLHLNTAQLPFVTQSQSQFMIILQISFIFF